MPHCNTVFHTIASRIPWGVFTRAVAVHRSDRNIRRLPTRAQFMALLFGQIQGIDTLRGLIATINSHAPRHYHLGLCRIARSSLADANAKRPAEVFAAVLSTLIAKLAPKHAREMGESLRLIDSTSLDLNHMSENWARFSTGVCGAKAHVVYDPDAACPLYVAVTAQRTNDITAAKQMPIDPGATYVFDLGYYDFRWWAKLHGAGCRIVTRLKRNTPLAVQAERKVAPGGPIRSDRTGYLPTRLAGSRKNPMADLVREVVVRIDSGKELRLLTNDLRASAEAIAALYKRRWAIELFFRWIKQTLKIRHFLGTSENAVRIQVLVALIAYVLLRLAHTALGAAQSPLTMVRLVKQHLMQRTSLAQLLWGGDHPPPEQNQRQESFAWV